MIPILNPSAPSSTPAKAKTIPGVTHIIAVASGKGGVGKSTTALNLAVALVANGLKIGVLDADIYGPSLPRLTGTSGRPQISEQKRIQPHHAFGLTLMSIGYLNDETTPTIWRGPMATGAIQQFLHQVEWGTLDVLVIDMPPGTGDVHLTIAQQSALSGAVIVSTPQDIALIDARKGLAMFERVNVPVLGIVENMSYFTCPHCQTRSDIFSHGGAAAEAHKLGVPFLGEIPLAMPIREHSDAGTPIVAAEPDSALTAAYKQIAARVWEGLQIVAQPMPTITMED